MKEKAKELVTRLNAASDAYYNGKDSGMSDHQWDTLFDELKELERKLGYSIENSPTQKVGAAVSKLKTVRHEQPALSLDKVKYENREGLVKWLGGKQGIISWKCDGSTLVLTYDNGKLTQAATRGDGEVGSDVTHNAPYFKGVPTEIPYKGHLVVRGEAMMTFDEFERINAETGGEYENPRNLATATVQMLDPNEARKREIIFKAFELVVPEPAAEIKTMHWEGTNYRTAIDSDYNMSFQGDRLNWLEALGFDVVEKDYVKYEDILAKIDEWQDKIKSLDYPTDGLVISLNDMVYGMSLGATGHHFKHSIALKWTDETAETTIRDIGWSVGKTGVITPVAVFDSVRLGLGSNVSRASLHNLSILGKLAGQGQIVTYGVDIKGCKADVYLANLIIPQVSTIYRNADAKTIEIPTKCPVCGGHTEVVERNGVATLHCTNHDGCPAQQVGKLVNTFGKDGLDVKGLSEKKIQFLVNEGYATSVLDFYKLENQGDGGGVLKKNGLGPHLEDQPGWEIKSVDNLLAAIETSRDTTLQKFLYSLNIPLLGNDLSKKLAKYWNGDINSFITFIESADAISGYRRETIVNELVAIDGIGEEKATNIANWAAEMTETGLWEDEIKPLIKELHFPEADDDVQADNSLSGLTFVITGAVCDYKNRDEFKTSVEARGGKVAGSVSAKTTFLVNNDVESTSGKNQKAKELGIPIISEDEFISRFGR